MEIKTKEEHNSGIKLDRKSKILFIILAFLIAGSVVASYYRYMIKRDYIVQAQIECDPETEKCFVWECDPTSLEEEKCTGNPDNDTWYYKIFRRNAQSIPDCDPADENCPAYVCGEGEADCSEELCTPENVPEEETCNDPEQYLLENPPKECEEGDEECLSEAEEECAPDDEECLAEEAEAEIGTGENPEDCGAENQDCATSKEAEQNLDEERDDIESLEDINNIPEGVEPI